MTDNKNVPKIIENSGLALHKTHNLLSITEKILASKRLTVVDDKQKILNLLAEIMDARFKEGYLEFKPNSRYIIGEIRKEFGAVAADSITIRQLKGAYISFGLGSNFEEDVIKIKSIEELYENTEQKIETLPLMCNAMETAFKLGHIDFKENAKFVVDAIRKQSAEAANLIAIYQLKAGYINYSQSGEVEGTTQIQELTQYNSIEDIYA